jgi:hypothetical protein
MTKQTAIMKQSAAIKPYGEETEITTIMNRLMSLHPQSGEVGTEGMRAVAQLSLMVGANPLPGVGEVHVWRDWKGQLSVMLGIAYYRRKAKEKDSVIWMERNDPRPMTNEERKANGVNPNDLAAICKGYVLSTYLKLIETGMPWDVVERKIARTGTAIVSHKEMFHQTDKKRKNGSVYAKKGEPIPAPNGRTWQWVAQKRAEMDFYRTMSLIDTTITDAFEARKDEVLALMKERPLPQEHNPFSNMSLEDVNEQLFGNAATPTHSEPVIVVTPPEPEPAQTAPPPSVKQDETGELSPAALRSYYAQINSMGKMLYGRLWETERKPRLAVWARGLDWDEIQKLPDAQVEKVKSTKGLTEFQYKKVVDFLEKTRDSIMVNMETFHTHLTDLFAGVYEIGVEDYEEFTTLMTNPDLKKKFAANNRLGINVGKYIEKGFSYFDDLTKEEGE